MVNGLAVFKKYFDAYPDNYVIIGGTACDMIIGEAGFRPRATKDIDIILVVEALNTAFVKQFWQFIQDGDYSRKEKSGDEKKCYRFMEPKNREFPFQIELFARKPELLDIGESAHLTPIPVDDDLSRLSAILLNDDFYHFMLAHCTMDDGLHRANTEALICLKAKACLDIADRIAGGSREDSKQIGKHKKDVFRLTLMLKAEDVFELPEPIKKELQTFTNTIANDLPAKAIFKEMGAGSIDPENVFKQIVKSFQLNGR